MDQILPESTGFYAFTLLKQFKLSKLIEVEKYQHQETTLLQLGAHFVVMYIKNLGPVEFLFYFFN